MTSRLERIKSDYTDLRGVKWAKLPYPFGIKCSMVVWQTDPTATEVEVDVDMGYFVNKLQGAGMYCVRKDGSLQLFCDVHRQSCGGRMPLPWACSSRQRRFILLEHGGGAAKSFTAAEISSCLIGVGQAIVSVTKFRDWRNPANLVGNGTAFGRSFRKREENWVQQEGTCQYLMLLERVMILINSGSCPSAC